MLLVSPSLLSLFFYFFMTVFSSLEVESSFLGNKGNIKL